MLWYGMCAWYNIICSVEHCYYPRTFASNSGVSVLGSHLTCTPRRERVALANHSGGERMHLGSGSGVFVTPRGVPPPKTPGQYPLEERPTRGGGGRGGLGLSPLRIQRRENVVPCVVLSGWQQRPALRNLLSPWQYLAESLHGFPWKCLCAYQHLQSSYLGPHATLNHTQGVRTLRRLLTNEPLHIVDVLRPTFDSRFGCPNGLLGASTQSLHEILWLHFGDCPSIFVDYTNFTSVTLLSFIRVLCAGRGRQHTLMQASKAM